MSGVNDWSQAERDLYATGTRAILDDLERQRQEWSAGAALDTTSADAVVRKHNAKMRQLEEDHKAWLARFINGEADEPAPTQNVAARGPDASPPSPSGSSDGHSPGQQPNPHTDELERARAIRSLSMSEYAERRAELGVQSPTSMSRLSGH